MAFNIRVPDSAFHEQTISIGSESYNIIFKFNDSDKAWYFALTDLTGEVLLQDTKVMPNQNLTGRFPAYNPFPSGNIWCLRVKNDFQPIDRNNLGFDKPYELVYLTFAEELELGIDGTIQL